MRLLRSLSAALLLLLPRPAAAQLVGGIEALFSNTEAITVSGNVACMNSSTVSTAAGGCGLYGFGLEALINLARADTAGGWGVEMALGYGQLSGFTSGDPALDLRGAIRQLPSLAVYASHERAMPLGFDQFYFGFHTGFLQTVNLQAYDAQGRQYSAQGETFEFGFSLGVWEESGFFVEPGYWFRRFPSLNWSLPGDIEGLPPEWPRALNLSGPSVSVGYQFAIPQGKE
jgi:hypothetical protein